MSMNVSYFWCLFWASLFILNLQLPLWKGMAVFKVIKGGTNHLWFILPIFSFIM